MGDAGRPEARNAKSEAHSPSVHISHFPSSSIGRRINDLRIIFHMQSKIKLNEASKVGGGIINN